MTFHWPNPSLSTIFKPSRVVLLGLWLALLPGVPQASPVTFDAHYEFYRDNSHVADTRLSLHQKEHQWIWTMQTEPRGFYRWLTSKKPFEEVRMIGSADALQLQQMYKGDHPEQPAEQTTFFDNASGVPGAPLAGDLLPDQRDVAGRRAAKQRFLGQVPAAAGALFSEEK